MEKSVMGSGSDTARRAYATPTLVVHGTLVELTHGGGGKSAGAPYGNANGHHKFPPKS